MSHRRLTVADTAVLVLAVATVTTLYAALWSGNGAQGEQATVWVAGEHRHTLPLSQARTLRVEGPLGESIIEVDRGRVRVADSPGRQRRCVKAGWLSSSGESAICLPNQVVVKVTGGEPRFDSINF